MIFLPIVTCPEMPELPYVNEWEMKVFVDVEAHMEDLEWAVSWNHRDPTPTIKELNPLWYFEAEDGWLIDYTNFILFEDYSYHWWSRLPDEEEVCFKGSQRCYARWGEKAVQIRSLIDEPDIDVIIVKLKPDPDYCPTCIPSWKP